MEAAAAGRALVRRLKVQAVRAAGSSTGDSGRVAGSARAGLRLRRLAQPTWGPLPGRALSSSSSSSSSPSPESSSSLSQESSSAGATTGKRVYRPMTETMHNTLNPAHFFALLKAQNTTFFTGVPDSLLKDICAYITETVPESSHVISANEGTALATAAGHYLATRNIPCVYLQNSGLGNLVNPLLSLCSSKVYSIPVLLLIGWRGEPGVKDEPQHLLQGKLTPSLLEEMGVPYEILPGYGDGAFDALEKAYRHMREEKSPFALLVKKHTFDEFGLVADQGAFSDPGMLHREEVLERIIEAFPEAPLVTTTGFTSREVFELRQLKGQSHAHDFLTVGSMGHCSSIALGIALSKPQAQVLCVDGDGAALMHLGSMATLANSGLPNLKHVIINNAVHDSVGGQPTGAATVDFPAVARACGYRSAGRARQAEEVGPALERLRDTPGPCLLECQVLPGARADLGRPTTSPDENRDAFMEMLGRL